MRTFAADRDTFGVLGKRKVGKLIINRPCELCPKSAAYMQIGQAIAHLDCVVGICKYQIVAV